MLSQITNSTKQWCALTRKLFSVFQQNFKKNGTKSLCIRTRLNCQPFLVPAKTTLQLVREIQFVDNAALIAHSERYLQVTYCFMKATKIFNLEISHEKTVILQQHIPCLMYHRSDVSNKLNIISSDVKLRKTVDNKTVKNKKETKKKQDISTTS